MRILLFCENKYAFDIATPHLFLYLSFLCAISENTEYVRSGRLEVPPEYPKQSAAS